MGIVLSMVNNALGFIPVLCGVYTIQLILEDRAGTVPLHKSYILLLTAVLVGSILLRWLLAYVRATKQDTIAHEVTTEERLEIGDVLKRVPLGFMQESSIGELSTAITTDLAFFEIHTMNVINNLVDSYFFLLLTVIGIFTISPVLALITAATIILSTAALQLLESFSRKNAPVRQESVQEMAAEIVQYVRGMAVVKSFKQEGVASEGLFRAYEKSKNINIKMERNFAPFDALHRLVLYLGTTAILFFAAIFALQGAMQLPMAIMMIVYSFIMFNNIEVADKSLHLLEILDIISEKLEKIKAAEFI
ncbi:MAG: ABC transporter transmembrane domain-containing protein, partial [Oscillospiraceae bacterium]